MKKDGKKLIIIVVIILVIFGGFLIIKNLKLFPKYETTLCAGDGYRDRERYAIDQSDIPFEKRLYGPTGIAFNEELCKKDCATKCSELNMKYYASDTTDTPKYRVESCGSIENNIYTDEPEYDVYSCGCKCV